MTRLTAHMCAATAGLAIMALEICGPRLLAPAYGSGTIVWSMVIATTLLALAIGGMHGGRISEDDARAASMPFFLGLGGLSVAASSCVTPILAPAISSRFPFGPWGQTCALAVTAAAVLIAPGVLLAAVFPLCLRANTSTLERAGRSYASLYAASTLGSLAGVLLPPLMLMGLVGTRASVVCCSLPAVVTAVVAMRRKGIAAIALLAGGGLLWGVARPPTSTAWESAYGAYEIIDQGDTRVLAVDRGLCYSVLRRDMRQTGLYHDVFLAAPALAGCREPRRIAVVGVAGGTLLHLFHRAWPQAEIDAVEIDPSLVAAARERFDLGATGASVTCIDGRCWLRDKTTPFDLIAVDAMTTGVPPTHLLSQEFFTEAAVHLKPGGVLAVNTLPPLDGPVSAALQRALPNTIIIHTVAVGSKMPLRLDRLATAHDWPGWRERATQMRADAREAAEVACLSDDAGTLPWWWGLRVRP